MRTPGRGSCNGIGANLGSEKTELPKGVRDSWANLISKPNAGRRRGGPRQGAAETVRIALAMSRF